MSAMALYATERIDDAVSLTRSLLFPFDAGLWARLVVVIFFLGLGSGGGNVSGSASNVPSAASGAPGANVSVDSSLVSVSDEIIALIAIAVVALLAVGLVFAYVGATMEFVFVESLADQSVAIRRGFGRHKRRGLRLFGFRLVLFLLTAVVFLGLALALFWGPITTLLSGGDPTIGASAVFVAIGAFLLAGVVVGLPVLVTHGLTTEFVVPIMLTTDCGVLAGWKRLWPTITAQWKQYLVYLVVAIGLRIATTTAAGILIGLVGFLLAIPFVLVGLVLGFGAITSGTITTAMVIGIVALALVFVALLWVVGAVVYVPIQSFHRYFALLFIGDVETDFDVLDELRPPLDDGFQPSSTL